MGNIKFKKIKTTGKNTDLQSVVTDFNGTPSNLTSERDNNNGVIGSNLLGKVEKISLRKKTLKLDNTYARESPMRSSGRPPIGNTDTP